MLIAVYGSLLKGLGNHPLLETSELVGDEVLPLNYDMLDLGGFPGLTPKEEESDIFIEVYKVDDDTFKRLDRLEGYPHFYNRKLVETSFGEAWIYYLSSPREYTGINVVESGNWRKHYEEKRSAIFS